MVAACLDRLPDPPAVNPNRIDAKALCLDTQLESAADHHPERVLNFSTYYSAVQYPVFENVFESTNFAHRLPLMRQAADSSPPVRVS